jgi:hypothetical protein
MHLSWRHHDNQIWSQNIITLSSIYDVASVFQIPVQVVVVHMLVA